MVIFSVKQKKKLAIALMAVSLVSAQYSFAENSDSNAPATGLAKIYKRIAEFITTSKDRVDSFFDKKNNQSYAAHISIMEKEIKALETDIQHFRGTLIADSSDQGTLYTAIVRKTDEIIDRVHKNLDTLHKALNKAGQNGKNKVPTIISALTNIQKDLTNNLKALTGNIQELFVLTQEYDKTNATNLSEQVFSIKGAVDKVNEAAKKTDGIAVFTAIVHRVKC